MRANMTQRIVRLLCILVLFIGCVPQKQGKVPVPDDMTVAPSKAAVVELNNTSSLTIFITGDTGGQLKPCGCAAGQLGGFSRRPVVLDTVAADKRLIIDTGNFIIDDSEQSLLKFDTMVQSLTILEYDVVNLNQLDLQVLNERYPFNSLPLETITAYDETEAIETTYKKNFQIGNRSLQVNVFSALVESLDIEKIQSQLSEDPKTDNFNILIIDRCDPDSTNFLADSDIFDAVVCPYSNDEPQVIKTKHQRPLFISSGKLGKYIGRLNIEFNADDNPRLEYTPIRIDERLAADAVLEDVYKNYQNMLKEDDILGKVIRTPLPEGLKYAGSDKCKICHSYEYDKWKTKKHAHAYQTLVDVGSQYDPECIECHVIGLKYESGFKNEKSPKSLRNVGCEICHGPRSEHIKNPKKDADTYENAEPTAAFDCISCHSPEHSPGFQSDEVGYRQKIIHWQEQKD